MKNISTSGLYTAIGFTCLTVGPDRNKNTIYILNKNIQIIYFLGNTVYSGILGYLVI